MLFSFRNSDISVTGNSMSFSVQNFPAVSSIDLFNLGSFLFPAELYHNLSAETYARFNSIDPTSGESSYVLLYWRGVSLRVVDCRLGGGVACCGKGEKAYGVFFFCFLAETANLILENAQKKVFME